MSIQFSRSPFIFSLLSSLLFGLTMPVVAQKLQTNNAKSAEQSPLPYTLPGVQPAKPIVTPPEAEPDDNKLRTDPDGSFMIGNTRVKISGSVTVDIGKGASGRNQRP